MKSFISLEEAIDILDENVDKKYFLMQPFIFRVLKLLIKLYTYYFR